MAHSSVAAGVRSLIVEGNFVGRRVYREEVPDNAALPRVLIEPSTDVQTLNNGDGGVSHQARLVELVVYQKPGGTSNPALASELAQRLHRKTIVIDGYGAVFLRVSSIVNADEEGYYAQRITVTAHQPAHTP